MKRPSCLRSSLILLCLALGACQSLVSRPSMALEPLLGERVTLEEVAARLADYDVVFLGEMHDSAQGHWRQFELTKFLADRRGAVLLTLEMFERDVQDDLNAYLRGEIEEEVFLERSRPWKDYAEFYRPAIEWARRTHRVVIAANVPRPLAARVAREGLASIAGEVHAPKVVHADAGEYRRLFFEAMGGHGLPSGAEEYWYQAQCLKDDAMAESIVDALEQHADARPMAVHWCGRFHSDYALGTVERVKLRRPDLRCAIVTMVREREAEDGLSDSDALRADYVLVVPE